jgi:hypothetical protein
VINKTKKECITDCFLKALYYWYTDDKFNARNALSLAVYLAKDWGYVSKEKVGDGARAGAEVLALDFPAKRAASSS